MTVNEESKLLNLMNHLEVYVNLIVLNRGNWWSSIEFIKLMHKDVDFIEVKASWVKLSQKREVHSQWDV